MKEIHFLWWGPSSNLYPNPSPSSGAMGGAGGFLSPDSSQPRRSKSDSGRPSHHRQSRSEDIASSPIPHHHLLQAQTHLPPDYHPYGHGHRFTERHWEHKWTRVLVPPSLGFSFSVLSRVGPGSNANNASAFLTHDTLPIPPIRSLSPGSSNKGHYRRTSSGPRSKRGA